MREVIFETKRLAKIRLANIGNSIPIFAKRNDKLRGMVVQEREHDNKWILKIGGDSGCSGWFNTREDCMLDALQYGYTFYIED